MSNIAVVIGRFQVAELTDGHIGLIKHIQGLMCPDHFFVGIGVSPTKFTNVNPLGYLERKYIVESAIIAYSSADYTINPILDLEDDEEWYAKLDKLLIQTFPNDDVTLYGGRFSFIKGYLDWGKGKFKAIELILDDSSSGTDYRNSVANSRMLGVENNEGIIYAVMNQYPKVYPTVDIAIYNDNHEILLGRKPGEKYFRFIGGFVDPKDLNLEAAAAREMSEETGITPNSWAAQTSQFTYVASSQMDDWRYRSSRDRIHTTLFAHRTGDGSIAKPNDDIQEVKWFSFIDFINTQVMPVHVELKTTFIKWFQINVINPTLITVKITSKKEK